MSYVCSLRLTDCTAIKFKPVFFESATFSANRSLRRVNGAETISIARQRLVEAVLATENHKYTTRVECRNRSRTSNAASTPEGFDFVPILPYLRRNIKTPHSTPKQTAIYINIYIQIFFARCLSIDEKERLANVDNRMVRIPSQ